MMVGEEYIFDRVITNPQTRFIVPVINRDTREFFQLALSEKTMARLRHEMARKRKRGPSGRRLKVKLARKQSQKARKKW